MSKVKTRNEIKAEMADLSDQITALKNEHSEQVTAFESQIAGLNADLEAAKTKLVEADKTIEAKAEEIAALTAEMEAVKASLTEAEDAKAKAEGELHQGPATRLPIRPLRMQPPSRTL